MRNPECPLSSKIITSIIVEVQKAVIPHLNYQADFPRHKFLSRQITVDLLQSYFVSLYKKSLIGHLQPSHLQKSLCRPKENQIWTKRIKT